MVQRVLLIHRMLKVHANFNGLSKHHGVGIFTVMKLLKGLVSSEMMKMLALQEIKWER